MRKYTEKEKKVDLYDVTDLLRDTVMDLMTDDPEFAALNEELSQATFILMNIRTFINGELDRVESHLGIEGASFEQVASGSDLAAADNMFDYENYMRTLVRELPSLFLELLDPDEDAFHDTFDEEDGLRESLPEISDEDMETMQELLRKYGLEAELEEPDGNLG